MTDDTTLSGVWNGLYSYSNAAQPESNFTAVLFDTAGQLSGTIHETMMLTGGRSTEASAFVDGTASATHVVFQKTYDGTNGQTHTVSYDGTLSADAGEIDGTWQVRTAWGLLTGRFLMIRARRAGQSSETRIAEKA